MHLHVICFDQPYPPAYGGAVEMFYKLKAMHDAGFNLTLHIFLYNGAKPEEETERLAEKTYYYKRKTGIKPNISLKPYIVVSRKDSQLLENLCKDNHPILFEGLHTTYFLSHPRLAGRVKMVRTHNIEHTFYLYLAKNNPLSPKAAFYAIEAIRLWRHERVLRHANRILAISQADADELAQRYPDNDVRLLNCFFDNAPASEGLSTADAHAEEEPYALYHANLAVNENTKTAEYIMRHIAPAMPHQRFIIAGRKPAPHIMELASKAGNVTVMANPSQDTLQRLIRHATINLMLTFQPTGIKLKLLTTLAKSKGHCIANSHMLHGNALAPLCVRADSTQDIISAIERLATQPCEAETLQKRLDALRQMGFCDVSNLRA